MKFERLWLLGRHGVYLREFSNQRGSKGNYWVGWRRTLSRMAMFYAIADTQLCLFQHYSSRWGEKEKGYWTWMACQCNHGRAALIVSVVCEEERNEMTILKNWNQKQLQIFPASNLLIEIWNWDYFPTWIITWLSSALRYLRISTLGQILFYYLNMAYPNSRPLL